MCDQIQSQIQNPNHSAAVTSLGSCIIPFMVNATDMRALVFLAEDTNAPLPIDMFLLGIFAITIHYFDCHISTSNFRLILINQSKLVWIGGIE